MSSCPRFGLDKVDDLGQWSMIWSIGAPSGCTSSVCYGSYPPPTIVTTSNRSPSATVVLDQYSRCRISPLYSRATILGFSFSSCRSSVTDRLTPSLCDSPLTQIVITITIQLTSDSDSSLVHFNPSHVEDLNWPVGWPYSFSVYGRLK